MLLKVMNRIANLMIASAVVSLLGFVADAACLGALIAWIAGATPRYIGLAFAVDLFLYSIRGIIRESIKRNSYKLAVIAEELKKSSN